MWRVLRHCFGPSPRQTLEQVEQQHKSEPLAEPLRVQTNLCVHPNGATAASAGLHPSFGLHHQHPQDPIICSGGTKQQQQWHRRRQRQSFQRNQSVGLGQAGSISSRLPLCGLPYCDSSSSSNCNISDDELQHESAARSSLRTRSRPRCPPVAACAAASLSKEEWSYQAGLVLAQADSSSSSNSSNGSGSEENGGVVGVERRGGDGHNGRGSSARQGPLMAAAADCQSKPAGTVTKASTTAAAATAAAADGTSRVGYGCRSSISCCGSGSSILGSCEHPLDMLDMWLEQVVSMRPSTDASPVLYGTDGSVVDVSALASAGSSANASVGGNSATPSSAVAASSGSTPNVDSLPTAVNSGHSMPGHSKPYGRGVTIPCSLGNFDVYRQFYNRRHTDALLQPSSMYHTGVVTVAGGEVMDAAAEAAALAPVPGAMTMQVPKVENQGTRGSSRRALYGMTMPNGGSIHGDGNFSDAESLNYWDEVGSGGARLSTRECTDSRPPLPERDPEPATNPKPEKDSEPEQQHHKAGNAPGAPVINMESAAVASSELMPPPSASLGPVRYPPTPPPPLIVPTTAAESGRRHRPPGPPPPSPSILATGAASRPIWRLPTSAPTPPLSLLPMAPGKFTKVLQQLRQPLQPFLPLATASPIRQSLLRQPQQPPPKPMQQLRPPQVPPPQALHPGITIGTPPPDGIGERLADSGVQRYPQVCGRYLFVPRATPDAG